MRRTIHLVTAFGTLLLYLAPILTVASPTKKPVNSFSGRERKMITQFNLEYYNNHILTEKERADSQIQIILSDFQKCFRYYEEKIAKYQARMDRARTIKDTKAYEESRSKAEEAKRRQNSCFEQRDSRIATRIAEISTIQEARLKFRIQIQKRERIRQEKESKRRLELQTRKENERQQLAQQIKAMREQMERQEREKERDLEIIHREIEQHQKKESQAVRQAEAELTALRNKGAELKAQHELLIEREKQRRRTQTQEQKQQRADAQRKLFDVRREIEQLEKKRAAYRKGRNELLQFQLQYNRLVQINEEEDRHEKSTRREPSDDLKTLRLKLADQEGRASSRIREEQERMAQQEESFGSHLRQAQRQLLETEQTEEAIRRQQQGLQAQLHALEAPQQPQSAEMDALIQQNHAQQSIVKSSKQQCQAQERTVAALRSRIQELDAQISDNER